MKLRPFRYKIYGEGHPVVIIPGLDGITEFFDDIIPELARRFLVIKYYLPFLAELTHAKQSYCFENIAADLKKVLEELGIERAYLIGESFGGVLAQVFTLIYPTSVDKLVLISSAAHFELSRKNRWLRHIFPIVPMWLFARVHVHDVCEPSDPQWVKDLFVRNATWADHGSVVVRAWMASEVDLRDKIASITAPILLIVGENDQFTGKASREMQQLLPNCKIVEIPGGHLCHVTHPKLFLEATQDFLENS